MKKIGKFSSLILIFLLQLLGSNSHAASITIEIDSSNLSSKQLEWRDRGHFSYTEGFLTRVSWLDSVEPENSQSEPSLPNRNKEIEQNTQPNSWANLVKSLQGIKLNGNNGNIYGRAYVTILARVGLGDIYKNVYDYNITIDRNNVANESSLHQLLASTETLNSLKTTSELESLAYKTRANSNLSTNILADDRLITELTDLILIPNKGLENSLVTELLSPGDRNPKTTLVYSINERYNSFLGNGFVEPIQKYQINYSIVDRYSEQQSSFQKEIDREIAIKKQQLEIQKQYQRMQIEQAMRQIFEEQQKKN
jgi:hypothetical protein